MKNQSCKCRLLTSAGKEVSLKLVCLDKMLNVNTALTTVKAENESSEKQNQHKYFSLFSLKER
jgi:hypothetical protein